MTKPAQFTITANVSQYKDAMYELEKRLEWIASLRPDEPCDHRGCLHHVTHPCEGCGRIAGQYAKIAAISSAVTVQNRLRFLLP